MIFVKFFLVSSKNVSCIHFIDYIVEAGVIAICYDGLTLTFKVV